jgi:hypothetical protein
MHHPAILLHGMKALEQFRESKSSLPAPWSDSDASIVLAQARESLKASGSTDAFDVQVKYMREKFECHQLVT